MLFPEGPEGPAGKSAYDIWVEAVINGDIEWPEDRTDVNNFFLYLKGEDGKYHLSFEIKSDFKYNIQQYIYKNYLRENEKQKS